MVLVDTSVWVSHLRDENPELERLLNYGDVVCHSFIIGELACGNLKNRTEILSLLNALPIAPPAEHEEVMHFIENYRLMGKGLGYIDMHLLTAGLLNQVRIWTLDKKLNEVSLKLGLQFP
ncbi:MAG: type II toxin-antitoxin system VapC family toxin [Nitrospirae bacterium]|nr:type II toxin-antitoxin system VapC family toxin [Nitrospirota bacterium]